MGSLANASKPNEMITSPGLKADKSRQDFLLHNPSDRSEPSTPSKGAVHDVVVYSSLARHFGAVLKVPSPD